MLFVDSEATQGDSCHYHQLLLGLLSHASYPGPLIALCEIQDKMNGLVSSGESQFMLYPAAQAKCAWSTATYERFRLKVISHPVGGGEIDFWREMRSPGSVTSATAEELHNQQGNLEDRSHYTLVSLPTSAKEQLCLLFEVFLLVSPLLCLHSARSHLLRLDSAHSSSTSRPASSLAHHLATVLKTISSSPSQLRSLKCRL